MVEKDPSARGDESTGDPFFDSGLAEQIMREQNAELLDLLGLTAAGVHDPELLDGAPEKDPSAHNENPLRAYRDPELMERLSQSLNAEFLELLGLTDTANPSDPSSPEDAAATPPPPEAQSPNQEPPHQE